MNFREELKALISRYNKEKVSNTPDFILAQYLIASLWALDEAVSRRSQWYSSENDQNETADGGGGEGGG